MGFKSIFKSIGRAKADQWNAKMDKFRGGSSEPDTATPEAPHETSVGIPGEDLIRKYKGSTLADNEYNGDPAKMRNRQSAILDSINRMT